MKQSAVMVMALSMLGGCRSTSRLELSRGNSVKTVSATDANRIKPEWLKPPTDPYRLGPGDRIEIELFGKSARRETAFVCPDGKIYFDLPSGIDVWALTLQETKERIERELAAYYTHPQVTVTLREVRSKCIWVLGRLNRPGIYPLTGPMRVL
ncbi:MAG: polysaccharide biosynthesis/export family protein, partial [Pseudomonadota bacterium]